MTLTREQIAERAASELPFGGYVNLGLGIPTLVSNYLKDSQKITIHSENGILNLGPSPFSGEEDPDLINASKETVTIQEGGSFFDSSLSFSMVRGGHIDVTVLGAMEVAENGDLANWAVPGKMISGMGGAMDLVVGAKKVIVTMEHITKHGAPKILKHCTLPLTGRGVVNIILTDLALIAVEKEGLILKEIAPGVEKSEVIEKTDATLIIAPDLKTMFSNL